jgi:sensor histidine kinase YesM
MMTENNGLGVPNIKKRLDLLYGEAHTLKIIEEAEIFIIKLTIPI